MSNLGRLERVELRDIWKTEAQDFTPWLAGQENLALLGETLGIDLELEAVEQNVGPFRADILCKDTLSDRWVLIENQLERTDHTHLGQLITYAAGLKAVTIVWIAARFTEEHRAACDWLNEITEEGIGFFALEVELWRIGGSPAAPKFNVISKPNDWSRRTDSAARATANEGMTDLKRLYLEYWQTFIAKADERAPDIRFSKPKASQYLVCGGLGPGMHVFCAISSMNNRVSCGITILGANAKAKLDFLQDRSEQLSRAFGLEPVWEDKPGTQRNRLLIHREQSDPTQKSDWADQHDWLIDATQKLLLFMRPLVDEMGSLDPSDEEIE